MISILMASYNGEQYIAEQIESLLNQTAQDFKLYICDDKSTDKSFAIVQDYASKYPEKIFITQNESNTGSAKSNFISMMIDHKDDYIMLCDQDDVWLPDKVEKSLSKIKELESKHEQTKPLLVHTNLYIVNESLETIAESFFDMANAKCGKNKLNNIIIQNIMAGCTIIYNRALADLIIDDKPKYMVMHDWWLALIASAFGEIGTIYEPTLLYRQHDRNEFGVNRRSPGAHLLHKLFNFTEVKETINSTYRQAESFLSVYKENMPQKSQELIAAYASMPNKKKLKKLQILCKYRIWKNGFIRKVAQVLAA